MSATKEGKTTKEGLVAVLGWCLDDFETLIGEVTDVLLLQETKAFLQEEGWEEYTHRARAGVMSLDRELAKRGALCP